MRVPLPFLLLAILTVLQSSDRPPTFVYGLSATNSFVEWTMSPPARQQRFRSDGDWSGCASSRLNIRIVHSSTVHPLTIL